LRSDAVAEADKMQNKTSSAVQLKHIPTGIVVKSQATRSRSQNRTIARRLLAEKLEIIEKGPESRVMMKAAVKQKKKASSVKKSKRKYRALAERKESASKDENGNMTDGKEEPHPLDAS
jgi:protein subunit release factor B